MKIIALSLVVVTFQFLCGLPAADAGQQLALSEIRREILPPPGGSVPPSTLPIDPTAQTPNTEVSPPGAIQPDENPPTKTPPDADKPSSPLDDVPADPAKSVPQTPEDAAADPARPNIDPKAPLPVVEYDLTKLPAAVLEMHTKIVAAAKSGIIENLRALIGANENQTQFTFGSQDEDPLAFLLSLSGDSGGQEILAILLEIMDAGYVHLDSGTPQDLYVWPYFFAIPLDKLTDIQRVELFKIVTSGDVEDMKSFGSYIFYRAGISPDGKWRFFLAGE